MRLLTTSARRFAVGGAATAFVIFVIALAAFLAAGPAHTKRVTEFASGHDPSAERVLIAEAEAHGAQNCESTTMVRQPTDTYFALVRAAAAVSCDAVGTGATRLTALRFATKEALKAWDQNVRALYRAWQNMPG